MTDENGEAGRRLGHAGVLRDEFKRLYERTPRGSPEESAFLDLLVATLTELLGDANVDDMIGFLEGAKERRFGFNNVDAKLVCAAALERAGRSA